MCGPLIARAAGRLLTRRARDGVRTGSISHDTDHAHDHPEEQRIDGHRNEGGYFEGRLT